MRRHRWVYSHSGTQAKVYNCERCRAVQKWVWIRTDIGGVSYLRKNGFLGKTAPPCVDLSEVTATGAPDRAA